MNVEFIHFFLSRTSRIKWVQAQVHGKTLKQKCHSDGFETHLVELKFMKSRGACKETDG